MKLNAAIAGCGIIHPNHAKAIIEHPNLNLYAVCDINGLKASEAAAEFGCKGFDNYDELINDKNIDVIHICTPHYLHPFMAIEGMKAGKHILTEKPMAMTAAAAEEMIRVSEETGKTLGVCFQNRYNSTSVMVREFIDSKRFGGVIGARGIVTWFRDDKYYTGSDWRGTWDKEGGGVLINQAIHTLDLIQWFLGDVHKLKANVDTRVLDGIIEVEDTADAVMFHRNGARSVFYATNGYVMNSPVEIEIVFEEAVVRICDGLSIKHADGTTEVFDDKIPGTGLKAYWGTGHKELINDFYSCLFEGRKFMLDGRQGISALRIIEAIYESSSQRKFVVL